MKKIILLLVFVLIASCSFAVVDASKLGLGARSVSLGRCSVALYDDINSMFVNPAMLTELESYSLSSMYVNLSEDIAFTQLGGAFPSVRGAFGASMLGSFSGGLIETTLEAGRVISTGATFDYSDAVYTLVYGNKYRENISYGVGLKFYSQNFDRFGNGSGFDMDLALFWKPNKKLKIGLVQQNTLPYSAGGKMEWSTGYSEGIPFSTRGGMSYQLRDNLLLLTDLEYANNRPLLAHMGAEWSLTKAFDLRAGIDQYAENPTAAITNYTLGVGLKIRNFHFDYAYYNDTVLAHNNASFFSVRFVPEAKKEVPPVPPKPILWLKTFKDVTYPDFGRKEIEHLATLDIITGYPDGTFKPKRALSRAEIVTLLVKATTTAGAFAEEEVSIFDDVSERHWAKKYVNYAVRKRWVKGFPDGSFKPSGKLTRAQAISMFSRFNQLTSDKEITQEGYSDVPPTHWAFKDVVLAKEAGWTDYITGNKFYPNSPFSRSEAAYILFRTSFAKKKISDMYDEYDVRRPDVP
jgi:S-layer homology domain